MGIKRFSQQQKLAILRSAAEMGVKEAAQVAEVHYTSVYEWKRQLEVLGEEGFLAYKSTIPGRGVKEITPKKEEAILTTWKPQPWFWSWPGQEPTSSSGADGFHRDSAESDGGQRL